MKQLERIITSHQEKPYFAYLELSQGGAVKVSSYKGVTTASDSDFAVHIQDKNCEFCFQSNYARNICKSQGESYFFENVLMRVLRSNSTMEKLTDPKFKELAVVFSAINNAKITARSDKRIPLRVDGDNLRFYINRWQDQLKAVNLINKLEKEGTSPKNAVYHVLEDIGTNDLVKACKEYGFKVEADIASSIWSRESIKQRELFAFVSKWGAERPEQKLAELEKEVKSIGADLCELQIRRRILKDEKSVRITEDRIKSLERDGVPEDEFLKEQYLSNLKYERAELPITQRNLQNIRNLEKAVEVLFPNELAKP
ncbi:hypothetical protein H0N99_03035 [Candidatus Micrarchaeota archaeon]|nr:hypothetical protein [Candidatus Micrarchaeota archaeon]